MAIKHPLFQATLKKNVRPGLCYRFHLDTQHFLLSQQIEPCAFSPQKIAFLSQLSTYNITKRLPVVFTRKRSSSCKSFKINTIHQKGTNGSE